MLSNEKAWGIARKDLAFFPKMIGLMLFLTVDAVQTPLMICGFALKIAANCLHSGLSAIAIPLYLQSCRVTNII
jgi:hypothetical protein